MGIHLRSRLWISVIGLLLLPVILSATHNRAGEIVVRQVGQCGTSLTVEATIVTYTESASEADRDTLTICWDDGTCDRVLRTNILPLEDGIQRNFYTIEHTYSGFGTYFISMTDPNRVANILNVNFPNSVNIPFSIYTIFTLSNPTIGGCNASPRLETPPLDDACVGEVWTHNPGAFDPDGDSLVFEFTVPLEDIRTPVPNYRFPDQISPGENNNLTIDRNTGQITWNAPVQAGAYNLAFLVISYRNGFPIDTMIRDMQIFVNNCQNLPPEVIPEVEEICVVAGELIEFDVVATAPLSDTNQLVQLTATGGPFSIDNSPATFTPVSDEFEEDPVTRRFRWQTTCEHISNQPYFVVFRAQDNFFGGSSGLATVKATSIKVVGPPPEDLRASTDRESILINWESPYTCEDAEDEFFIGFSVWRRLNSNAFVRDTCETGLAGRGYTRLTPVPIRDFADGRYIYQDDDVERGQTYCYRVIAIFGRRTAVGGFIFQQIESIPSEEICVQLNRDVPLMTKVDVETTDLADGRINVCWIRPSPTDLDTIINPGPYRYVVRRAVGQTDNEANFQPIGVEFVAQNFADPIDTCFVDSGLNTQNQSYSYLVDLFVANESNPLGNAPPASSIFLNPAGTDRAVDLSWTSLTPWANFSYTIFRRDPGETTFDSVGVSAATNFRDTGLENGEEYCYFVESTGTYSIPGLPSPLINRSQVACIRPGDNVAPCAPELTVENVCDRGSDCEDESTLFNTLRWTDPDLDCPTGGDVDGFRIYYKPMVEGEFVQVGAVDDARIREFEHQPEGGIAGCYAVSAIDTAGNESVLSMEVCVDNCPFYELPNAFTPNQDGQNDLFTPFEFCFIERVDFQLFNRWGVLVFETEDPMLNWDGTNLRGQALAEGTYYYRCQVFERRVGGIVEQPTQLSGYVELIR